MPNYLDSKSWKYLIIALTHAVDVKNDSDDDQHDAKNIIDEIDVINNEIGLKDQCVCLTQHSFGGFSTV